MDIRIYLIYLFLYTSFFVYLNYHILGYLELKISSRITRRLGINNDFAYLKILLFKLLRDIGKKRYEYNQPFEWIYYLFKPAVLLINIVILLLLRSAVNGNYSYLPVFLILFLLSSFFIILESLSSGSKEKVFPTLLNESVKLISIVPLIISVLTIYKITGFSDLSGILKILENQTLMFRQPFGFLVSLISIQIATEGIFYRKPGFKTVIQRSDSYLTDFHKSLSKFVITAFFVFLFLSGAQPINFKQLVIPGEIVLIVKTYLLSFLMIIFKNSLPVIKYKVLFRVITGVLIPISILNFFITMVFL